jgi:hypothetical protein
LVGGRGQKWEVRTENGVLGMREMKVAVGRIGRMGKIGQIGQIGRFSGSERECERRCVRIGGEREREVRSEK